MKNTSKRVFGFLPAMIAILTLALPGVSRAAEGEMGTGVPTFGLYSQATGVATVVWALGNAAPGFPSGCAYLYLTPATMGMDSYKMAVAMMTVAKLKNKRVRLFAHAPRDGGCGVDYVQLAD